MKTTRLGALALALGCAPGLVAAQVITWGCAFDRYSGRTICLQVDGEPPRNTGNVIVSPPNVGIPGDAYSIHGEKVRIYLGGNGTGYQKFRWQE